MTQSLPITPAALTRRARNILGAVGPHSVKVRHMTDVVDVYIGDVHQATLKAEEFGQRQRKLAEELTAEGYLAEPVGTFAVRVRRPEDVERTRREILAAGAADVARLADVGALRPATGPLSQPPTPRAETPMPSFREFADAPLPSELAAVRDAHLDAGDVAAVTEVLPEHLREEAELIARLAALVGSGYANGWNDGHAAGIRSADWLMLDVRQKLDELSRETFELDAEEAPAADPDEPTLSPLARLALSTMTPGANYTTTRLAEAIVQPHYAVQPAVDELAARGLIEPGTGGWQLAGQR